MKKKTTIEDKTIEERIAIDEKRKDAMYKASDLQELVYWLIDGYKECSGRSFAIDLLNAEIKKQRDLMEKYHKELFG